MTNRLENPTARRLACSRCGTEFSCDPTGACWCAEETAKLPMPVAGEELQADDEGRATFTPASPGVFSIYVRHVDPIAPRMLAGSQRWKLGFCLSDQQRELTACRLPGKALAFFL